MPPNDRAWSPSSVTLDESRNFSVPPLPPCIKWGWWQSLSHWVVVRSQHVDRAERRETFTAPLSSNYYRDAKWALGAGACCPRRVAGQQPFLPS